MFNLIQNQDGTFRIEGDERIVDGVSPNALAHAYAYMVHDKPMPEQQALIDVQMREYPDSNLDTNVFKWLDEAFQLRDDDNDKTYTKSIRGKSISTPDEVWLARQLDSALANIKRLERQLQIARGALCAYADFASDLGRGPVFYECCKQPDGTYKWRGARFGVEPNEYMSGFGRW